jgi:hypothetical protein
MLQERVAELSFLLTTLGAAICGILAILAPMSPYGKSDGSLFPLALMASPLAKMSSLDAKLNGDFPKLIMSTLQVILS